jgi:23S rRNA A1618 N6-methylase RlmF
LLRWIRTIKEKSAEGKETELDGSNSDLATGDEELANRNEWVAELVREAERDEMLSHRLEKVTSVELRG